MPTERQLAANRTNSQKSTGPRSPEGRAASSRNALKSGIYSRSPLIPGEDPAELEALRNDLYASFDPANADERELLESMIENRWILKRLQSAFHQKWTWKLETDAAHPDQRPHLPLVRAINSEHDQFAKLTRMMSSHERAYHRSRTALIKAQKDRKASQPVEPKPVTPKLASFRQKAVTTDPDPIEPAPTPTATPAILTPDSCLLTPSSDQPNHPPPSPVQRW